MTSLLAIALAASTLSTPAPRVSTSALPCCTRMAATCPLVVLTCCGPERPDPATQAPVPQAPMASAPDLVRLPANALPSLDTTIVAFESIVRLGTSPPLYLLHATLLV
jgi:hypothetical protein